MKRCPECRRDYYDDTLLYCLDDGNALLEGPASIDEPVTAVMSEGISSPGKTVQEQETRIYTSGDLISKELKRHKLGAAVFIAAFAVLVAGSGYGLYRFFEKPTASLPQGVPNIEIRRLTGDGKTNNAAISPDGKVLAYTRTEGELTTLWIKQIATDSSIQILGSEGLTSYFDLAFSPDGNFIYFNGFGKERSLPTIYRVPAFGGAPTRFLSNAIQISFSPDGKRIAFGRIEPEIQGQSIYTANLDGTDEKKVSTRTGRQFFNAAPTWSPDGKYLAVSTGDDDLLPAPDEGIVLISVADGSEIDLGKTKWGSVTSVQWHPGGKSLIIAASDYDILPGQLWEVLYPSGEARRLTNNLNGYRNVSITADGNAIVTMERFSRSAVWVSPDLDPSKAKPIMPSTGDTWGFSWTPDGRIVYTSDQSGDAEVWIMNADGSSAKQVTRDRLFKGFPDVSDDGRYIVYASAEGSGRLKRVSIDGGEPVTISDTGLSQDNPDISPDNEWVLYSAWVDGKLVILRAPLLGGEGMALTNVQSTEPRYSPDGRRFACFLFDERTQEWDKMAVYPADGGVPLKAFDLPPETATHRGPLWTPDGGGINYLVQNGERVNLWVQPIEGGAPKQVTDFELPYIARRAYSRDGKQIALVRAENIGNAIMITGFR